MSRFVLAFTLLCASAFYLVQNYHTVVARAGVSTKLPDKLLVRHNQYPDCIKLNDAIMPREGTVFRARLNKQTEIFGIMCEPSAYNWPYAIYIVRDGFAEEAERIFFADYNKSTGWTGTDLLYNASFDKKSGELKGFSKARGAGDCGSRITLKWNEDQFSLKEFRYKDACDGDIENPFPLIYKRYQGK